MTKKLQSRSLALALLATAAVALTGCASGPPTATTAAADAIAAAHAATGGAALSASAPTPAPATASPSQTTAAAWVAPEAGSGLRATAVQATSRFMVATANPLASRAGADILRAGGSAVDAAITVQLVLGLVEPQSSGIGGGAFMLHTDGRRVQAYDGRETAPMAATEALLLTPEGKPLPMREAIASGRSVGVPGALAMLELAHSQHGKLPWARLFAAAIQLADDGFAISPRMQGAMAANAALRQDEVAGRYFFDGEARAWPVGHVLKNPEYAAVLRLLAQGGAKTLLEGDLAGAIVNKVRSHPTRPGAMTLADLTAYRALERTALCFDYRPHIVPGAAPGATRDTRPAGLLGSRDVRVCGMPPPSSGALTVAQILLLMEHLPAVPVPLAEGLPTVAPRFACVAAPCPGGTLALAPSAPWLHLYTEASRLAFADRDQYIADPAYVPAPGGSWYSLLDTAYLAERASQVHTAAHGQSMMVAPPGAPGGRPAGQHARYAPMPAQEENGTTHVSIADAFGNALALTTSVEAGFGARMMVNRGLGLAGGFLLNNQLTDFSFAPRGASGLPVGNRVEPGKRPRSSMAPTLVFALPQSTPSSSPAGTSSDHAPNAVPGPLLLSGGSAGGPLIIHAVAKTLYAMTHWPLDVQQAIALPNVATLNGPTYLEAGRFAASTVNALKAQGHVVQEVDLNTGTQFIQKTTHGFLGGADPRREGLVVGD